MALVIDVVEVVSVVKAQHGDRLCSFMSSHHSASCHHHLHCCYLLLGVLAHWHDARECVLGQ